MSPAKPRALVSFLPCCALALALARAALAAGDAGESVCSARGCDGNFSLQETNPEGYYWRRRGGGSETVTSVPHRGPVNFSNGPAWAWSNSGDEQVRHSPLIDAEKNIYIATTVRIRKLSERGALLWTFESTRGKGKITSSPALYRGVLYALASSLPSRSATVYALDMGTGELRWQRTLEQVYVHVDAHSLLVYNDTIFFPARDHLETRPLIGGEDGNNQVRAMNASDGRPLWEYTADDIMWNLMVSTPGDGTLLFASQCGGVYRINWAGEQIWRAGRPNPARWCSCGGGTLGPNGMFYAEFNDWERAHAVVAAHRVSDGKLVWERTWPVYLVGGWQFPAVGRLAPHGRLAVVAPLGGITGMPKYPGLSLLARDWVPQWLQQLWYEEVYLKSSWVRRRILGVPLLNNAVVALDAETGEDIWWTHEAPWDRYAMAGDEERAVERRRREARDPEREDWICLPDPQGIPLIAGDGTVYASSSHTGDLASIRDLDGNGFIDAGEVSLFHTGIGFLNGPSLAPGMLVAAPCWGPVFVFKD